MAQRPFTQLDRRLVNLLRHPAAAFDALQVLLSGGCWAAELALASERLPPAHVEVAAGPAVVQGGDYFGRTVNLAARLAARAGAGQVLVSQRVAESPAPEGWGSWSWGEQPLEGIARPVRLLEARRA